MAGTDQRSGDMFVEHPDEVKVESDDGSSFTFCWMDHNRMCTGGCQAFDPMYADDESRKFTSCRIINLAIVASSAFSHFVRKMEGVVGTNLSPPKVK